MSISLFEKRPEQDHSEQGFIKDSLEVNALHFDRYFSLDEA
jgi:hypothetical protein